jgi:hypothetical protein
MIRKFALFTIAGAMTFAGQQAEPAAAPKTEALPKAETILDHFVEVTGGKAAYEQRKNEIATGTFEMAAQGIKGTMTIYSAPPDKSYRVIELEGVGKVESGTGDGVAWETNPMLGPRVLSGEEKSQNLREAAFNSAIAWRALYSKAETVGVETVDGQECYKVVLTPADGKPTTEFYDKKTGLEVKQSLITTSQQLGDVPAEATVSDYKEFDGILMPTKIVTKIAGQEFTITTDSVKVNQDIPADKFDPPAEIKALLKK